MLIIKEVFTKSDRKKFIQFQNDLYKDVENYIPTLLSDELSNLDPNKNPAYEFCDCRQWLCYRGGEIVGRVAAIVSRAANEIWDQKRIRFSRIDFIEDYEVFCLLMQTVEDWARQLGLTEIIGPMGFCDFDKEGMLVEGFEHQSLFITYYNHPYYPQFLERYGFEKEVDWLECKIHVDNRNEEKLNRICERVEAKLNVRYIELKNKRQLKPYIPQIFDLINEAYKSLFGVVPITEKQKQYYTNMFIMLINLRYIGLVVDTKGKLICLGLTAPSLSKPMKQTGGRLFPFGWIPLLKTIRRPDALDMYFIALDEQYKNTGVPAMLLHRISQRAYADGIKVAETGPELETNFNVLGLWDGFNVERGFKRRRCYRKQID